MAKQISTSILINATPEKLWAVLTNFEAYPSWNPFIKSITGTVAVGKRIKARIEPPGAKGMTFTPRVLVFDANREFRWLGHLFVPGLFSGEHSFQLQPHISGGTTFIQQERFTGILVPLFKKMLDNQTVNGFNQMNTRLKALAEA